jgi:hypothetical protein
VSTIDPSDTPTEGTDVTAATDEDVTFELSMEEAPEDYTPDRKTPGRERKASYFDNKLRAPGVFGGGWQRVPVSSEDEKAFVIRELNRAKLFLNGTGLEAGEPEIGLDLDDKKDDAVYFRSRIAQKRTRKGKDGEALSENAEEDGLDSVDGDNDE